jgi:hypothetical protein
MRTIDHVVSTLLTSHEDKSLVNDSALANMSRICLALLVFQRDKSLLNFVQYRNVPSKSFTLETSQEEISPINDSAELNVQYKLTKLLVVQLAKPSPENATATENMDSMDCTFSTFHVDKSPLNKSVSENCRNEAVMSRSCGEQSKHSASVDWQLP